MKDQKLKPAARPPKRKEKPDYGVDSPDAICAFLAIGAIATVAGLFIPSFHVAGVKIFLLGPTLLAIGLLSLALGASMLAYALRGKFNMRDRMLNLPRWRGDEAVLDIGTDRGLLAIGAAKRLKSGTATAIGAWTVVDSSGAMEKTLSNIAIERVENKVELKNDDARSISFVDNSFDAVFSLLFLHTIDSSRGREAACREIARVLKRGGTAVIADSAHAADYAKTLAEAGLRVEGPKSHAFKAYTAMKIVVARKPL